MPTPVKWSAADFELVNLENPEGEPWLSASPDGRFSLVFFETFAGPHTDLEGRIYTAAGVEQNAIGATFSAVTNEHQPASAYLPDGRRIDVARFLVTGGAGRLRT